MAGTVLGALDKSGVRDKDGHREFFITWLVQTTDVNDGPQVVMNAAGLPVVGSIWTIDNDADPFAFCWPNLDVRRASSVRRGDPDTLWEVDQLFSTKPLNRCQDTAIDNPIAEPYDISGGFSKETREQIAGRDGNIFENSSKQPIKGSIVEFDESRPNVTISFNVATLPLTTFVEYIDTLNDANLWGLSPRMIKLSNVWWSRRLYGTCTYYYRINYEFDIDFNTWDRAALDEGTIVLIPNGDPNNPDHYVLHRDCNDEIKRTLLDGAGRALAAGATPVRIPIEYYPLKNFLLLGIPATL